ncbi:MAG: glycosyltransferase family 4 protein [Bacteroidota bacterium]
MRILVLNWQDGAHPRAGGAEVHLHEIFRRVAARGHSVTLLCSSFPGAHPEEMRDGIRVLRRGGRFLFNYRVIREYFRVRRGGSFDVVVDDLNKIPFCTPLYVREPLVGIAHHLFGRSIFREAGFPSGVYVYLMERLGLAVYRAARTPFLVVSPSTREEFLRHGFPPKTLGTAYNCVDHDVYNPGGGTKSPTPLLGAMGRLKRYKSVDHLLTALPLIADAAPNVRLVVVGDGDDRPRLERLAHRLGVSARVDFTGYVSQQRKVELLRSMWLKVATSAKEGWGLTVLEANACGTPVLASDVPGLRDSIRDGETGVLYRYGDVGELARKAIRLLQDAAERERLAGNALRFARGFRWDAAAEDTLAFLRRRVGAFSAASDA